MSTASVNKNKETKNPGWLNIDRYDFFCSLYLTWFIFAAVLLFQGSSMLEASLGITANHERFITIYGSFILLVATSQTILGFKGSLLGIVRFYAWPAYIMYYSSSFAIQVRKTFLNIKSNFPLKTLFFAIIPVLYTVGINSQNKNILKVVMISLSIHLILSLLWGVKWSLNPFNFLKHSNFLQNTKIRGSIVLGLVKPDGKDQSISIEGLLKKVELLKKLVSGYEFFVSKLASNRALFVCFLTILMIVSTHVIIGGTVILRIFHVLSLPDGIIETNNFFNGSFTDFLYISINSFLPSDLHGISFINKEARWILTSITFSSYALLVIAMAGFSMAGSSKVEETITNFTKDLHGTIDEAASLLTKYDKNQDMEILGAPDKEQPTENNNPVVKAEFAIHSNSTNVDHPN